MSFDFILVYPLPISDTRLCPLQWYVIIWQNFKVTRQLCYGFSDFTPESRRVMIEGCQDVLYTFLCSMHIMSFKGGFLLGVSISYNICMSIPLVDFFLNHEIVRDIISLLFLGSCRDWWYQVEYLKRIEMKKKIIYMQFMCRIKCAYFWVHVIYNALFH